MQNLDTRHPMHFLIGLVCWMPPARGKLYEIIGAVEMNGTTRPEARYYLVLHKEGRITYATTSEICLIQTCVEELEQRLARHNKEML